MYMLLYECVVLFYCVASGVIKKDDDSDTSSKCSCSGAVRHRHERAYSL